MAQDINIAENNEITAVQFQASEIAASDNLDPAQTSIFSKVSDMVSNGILSLSNMYKEYTNETTSIEAVEEEYQQFLQLKKEAEKAKGFVRPQDGIDAVAKELKKNNFTLNPAVVKQQVTELTGYSADQLKGLQRQLNLAPTGKADADTASNLILYKNYLGQDKTATLLKSIFDGTLEGLRTNPVKNSKVLKHPLMRYGQKAVEAIEQREGALSYIEKRVAEEEGYFNGFYYDSKNVLTFGGGQTGEYMDKSFKETVEARTKVLKSKLVDYNKMPEKLQAELVQSAYRGDITGSPKTIKLMNEKKYQEAERAFLNNAEYRKAKREGSGIAKRMEKTARAIRMLSAVMIAQN